MIKRFLNAAGLAVGFFTVSPVFAQSVVETYPGLKKFVAVEKSSNLFFGFGVNPFNLVNGKIGFSASLFQLHYVKDNFDFEVINLSAGSFFGSAQGNEQFFLIRTAPKFKVFKNISVGPLLGMEFVHFPGVQAEISKDGLFSPPTDLSTVGAVYGASISETFEIGDSSKGNLLRITESLFKETYSVKETSNGWSYYYLSNSLNADNSPISPSVMFMLEISYLF